MNAIVKWRPVVDSVYCYDAETFLSSVPSSSVDLVVTSPPYNLRNSAGGGLKGTNDKSLWSNQPMRHGYDTYSDDLPNDEYVAWQRCVLVECMRALKPTGAMFYNHKWRVQNGLLQRLVDEIAAGFPVRQIIIWSRGAGINFNSSYFLPSYEVIYLIAKPDFVLQPGANAMMDVWSITPAEKKEHPNAFPEELATRCILAGSAIDEVVLDPFMGSGTTAIAARNLKRHYIGCDVSPMYVQLANHRLHGSGIDRLNAKPAAPITDLPLFASIEGAAS